MRRDNLIGQKFGRLLVIEKVPPVGVRNRPGWKCMCDCGNKEPVIIGSGHQLKSGNTQSCGCLRTELSAARLSKIAFERRKYPPMITTARRVFRDQYSRENDTITFDEFLALSQINCFYCNAVPSNKQAVIAIRSSDFHINNCTFIYNGLDRINNNLPHTLENCVSCCKECNLSKRNMLLSDFYAMVKNIIYLKNTPFPDYQQLFSEYKEDLSRFKRIKGRLFLTYKDIEFDFALFSFILTLDCFYCGIEPLHETKCKNGDIILRNGIDRIDQTKGHTLNNILPCCKICNWSKAKRSYSEFIAWAERVSNFQKQKTA